MVVLRLLPVLGQGRIVRRKEGREGVREERRKEERREEGRKEERKRKGRKEEREREMDININRSFTTEDLLKEVITHTTVEVDYTNLKSISQAIRKKRS